MPLPSHTNTHTQTHTQTSTYTHIYAFVCSTAVTLAFGTRAKEPSQAAFVFHQVPPRHHCAGRPRCFGTSAVDAAAPPPIALHVRPSREPASRGGLGAGGHKHTYTNMHTNIYIHTHTYIFICMPVRLALFHLPGAFRTAAACF